MKRSVWVIVALMMGSILSVPSRAALPVVDVGAILQLIQQIRAMQE